MELKGQDWSGLGLEIVALNHNISMDKAFTGTQARCLTGVQDEMNVG